MRGWVKTHQIPCHIWNNKLVFFYTLHHSTMSWEISLLYFCSWNFTWFLQKEPITVQNLRLLTAQVKFHQICTLIGYFCWKYIKFQLKKSMEELCLMIPKNGAKLEEKLIFCFKNDKNLVNFDPSTKKSKKFALWLAPFVESLCLTLKSTKELYFMTLKGREKFEEKLTCGLENDMRNLANFHQNTWKCQNWYFHGILLSKVKCISYNLQRSYK